MTVLQNNNPLLELTEENDLFGTLEKAKTIKSFVESYMHCFGEGERNKIIALYGPWGCGKTSLMNHLKDSIEHTVPVFFETWKYEKDGNLALSLLDAIAEEIENADSKDLIRHFLQTGANLLVSAAKSLSFNAGPLSFSGDTFISNIETSIEQNNSILSFHKRKTEFETQYQKIENEILTGQPEGAKLIVYIDDLDRCEPENVLSLMVALKHFFSLGKRTIFFCGIDKEAIGQAIKTKYRDIIQPDEYLEKIVDVSFSMPRTFDLRKFVATNFSKNCPDQNELNLITDFLSFIGFTNPRKLKLAINKYFLLLHIKKNKLIYHDFILEQDCAFSVSITFFFVILYSIGFSYLNVDMKSRAAVNDKMKKENSFYDYSYETVEEKLKALASIYEQNQYTKFLPSHFYLHNSTTSIDNFLKFTNFIMQCSINIDEITSKNDVIDFLSDFEPKTYVSKLQLGFCRFVFTFYFHKVLQIDETYDLYNLFVLTETLL